MRSETLAAMARVARGISKTASNDGIKEIAISRARMGFGFVETQLTALGFAYMNGRFSDDGEIRLPIPGTQNGAPLDLTLGLGLLTFSLFGLFGPFGEHTANVADGLVANYSVRLGQSVGATHRQLSAGGTKTTSGGKSSMYDEHGNPRSQAA